MVFLSKPQAYSCNPNLATKAIAGAYKFALNSEDMFDPNIPLLKSKAQGGTMILWKIQHDPYITVYPVPTTSFLPVVFSPPGLIKSVHIAIYLPTLGKEKEFAEELSKLAFTIHEISNADPGSHIFLRGDFNVNQNHNKRLELLNHFSSELSFLQVHFSKPTYHHFLGDGK